MSMVHIQIRVTPEQLQALRRLAVRENTSVAELIRIGIDDMLTSKGEQEQKRSRMKALAAAGKLSASVDLATAHDEFLAKTYNQ